MSQTTRNEPAIGVSVDVEPHVHNAHHQGIFLCLGILKKSRFDIVALVDKTAEIG